ncbi:hypothetical protein N9S42_00595 [Paracoccaceae bacterium]|jgi:hypothetical protein|nr:hypothetical protein [Paracoccaceae bacterium]
MKHLTLTISLILGATAVSAVDATGLGNLVEIYSINQIDDHRGYCFDIKGHKSNAKIDKGLQAHTCYSYQGEIAVDQGFDVVNLKNNDFFLPAFGVCMEATAATSAATLKLGECNNKRLQDFKWDNHGRIYLDGNTKLCVTIAKGKARNGGGGSPVHKIRNLSMEFCGADMGSYQIWATRKVK